MRIPNNIWLVIFGRRHRWDGPSRNGDVTKRVALSVAKIFWYYLIFLRQNARSEARGAQFKIWIVVWHRMDERAERGVPKRFVYLKKKRMDHRKKRWRGREEQLKSFPRLRVARPTTNLNLNLAERMEKQVSQSSTVDRWPYKLMASVESVFRLRLLHLTFGRQRRNFRWKKVRDGRRRKRPTSSSGLSDATTNPPNAQSTLAVLTW